MMSIKVDIVNELPNDVVGNACAGVVCNWAEVSVEVWVVTVTVCLHDPSIPSNGRPPVEVTVVVHGASRDVEVSIDDVVNVVFEFRGSNNTSFEYISTCQIIAQKCQTHLLGGCILRRLHG